MNQISILNDRMQGKIGYQLWEAKLAEQCGAFQAEPPLSLGIENFEGAIRPSSIAAAGYAGAAIEMNCPHIYRGIEDIKTDGHDFFYLIQQVSGLALMDHYGSETILNPGDLLLLDSTRPSDFYFPGMTEQIWLLIPRHRLENQTFKPNLQINKKIEHKTKTAVVAHSIISQLFAETATSHATEDGVLLETLIDLVLPAFSASTEPQSYCEKIQRKYFEKAQNYIEARLADFDLTPELIAVELGTSKRTLHRVFAQQGQSIGRYILDRRLDKCASELEKNSVIQKISAVAFAWGFNDVSHFSRAFKTKFGVSPKCYKQR